MCRQEVAIRPVAFSWRTVSWLTHQDAAARDVVELHGTLDRVVCLECGARSARQALDQRLRAANPDLDADELAISNPDGDGELAEEQVARFRVVGCACCGTDLLKPDVVFFGENVPRPRVQRCFKLLDAPPACTCSDPR